MINRNANQVNVMNRRTPILRDDGKDRTVNVRAATTANDAPEEDLVTVLVKSFPTCQAVRSATSLLSPEAVVGLVRFDGRFPG
ncbi:MAG: hypothetical protein EXS36_19545 [Pedosphaera sp.]|nr:hypothetical protein [Pedosphaera sp.]